MNWGLWITVWYGLVRLLFVMSPLTVTFSSPKLSFKLLTPSVLSSGAHSWRQKKKAPPEWLVGTNIKKEITARALNHQPTAEGRRKKRKEGFRLGGEKKNYIREEWWREWYKKGTRNKKTPESRCIVRCRPRSCHWGNKRDMRYWKLEHCDRKQGLYKGSRS